MLWQPLSVTQAQGCSGLSQTALACPVCPQYKRVPQHSSHLAASANALFCRTSCHSVLTVRQLMKRQTPVAALPTSSCCSRLSAGTGLTQEQHCGQRVARCRWPLLCKCSRVLQGDEGFRTLAEQALILQEAAQRVCQVVAVVPPRVSRREV